MPASGTRPPAIHDRDPGESLRPKPTNPTIPQSPQPQLKGVWSQLPVAQAPTLGEKRRSHDGADSWF